MLYRYNIYPDPNRNLRLEEPEREVVGFEAELGHGELVQLLREVLEQDYKQWVESTVQDGLRITMSCGYVHCWESLSQITRLNLSCGCGNPQHTLLRIKVPQEDAPALRGRAAPRTQLEDALRRANDLYVGTDPGGAEELRMGRGVDQARVQVTNATRNRVLQDLTFGFPTHAEQLAHQTRQELLRQQQARWIQGAGWDRGLLGAEQQTLRRMEEMSRHRAMAAELASYYVTRQTGLGFTAAQPRSGSSVRTCARACG